MSVGRITLALAAGLLAAACQDALTTHGVYPADRIGETPDAGSIPDAALTQQDAQQPLQGAAAYATVCDGSRALRLAFQRYVGLGSEPGSSILAGAPMLLVDGQCQLYMSDDTWHELRTVTLSQTMFEQLARLWRAADWQALAGKYCGFTPGSPTTTRYWLAGDPSSLVYVEDACRKLPAAPAALAQVPTQGAIDQFYAAASPANGPVWYSLVPAAETKPGPAALRNAPAWPLSDPALLQTTGGPPAPLHNARGADADALRQLRKRWVGGEIGIYRSAASYSDFIPVRGPMGEAYELRMRDQNRFENEFGNLVLPQ